MYMVAAERYGRSGRRNSPGSLSDYDGNAVRKLTHTEETDTAGAPAGNKQRSRTRVRVREADKVSVFSVIGFLAASLFIILMLMSYAKLVVVNDEAVKLRSDLSELKTQEAQLLAKYELSYDLQEIENTVLASGKMVKIQNSQIYQLELTEPDTVEYYQDSGISDGLIEGAKKVFSAIAAYF